MDGSRGALTRSYEPFNYFRQIVGFDTFSGFPDAAAREQDGGESMVTRQGTFGVPPGYAAHLSRLLAVHEQESPLAHIPRHELRSGDVAQELPVYLREHPETVVALAYFDFDLYEPTRAALEAILPHTTRGSILAFDQPTHATYPGETVAFKEVLDLKRYKMRRFSYQSHPAYVVIK
ncbi:hypothetical protein ACIQWZ_40010 [Streptomyces sp. NPDC098077]|uniref:hypothetical protein n=1 Tax=Streptomyces sp. NPDC098077 TaxID=3366093 RepID=UPI0038017EE4